MGAQRLRHAWLEFLRPYPWVAFITLTFDRRRHASVFAEQTAKADKDFRRLICFVNEQLYGKRWLRKTAHKGIVWVRVQERHSDGALHYHACLYAPSGVLSAEVVDAIRPWWELRFGMARAEFANSRCAVLRYLTKNVGNDELAEMDFSYNFPKLS